LKLYHIALIFLLFFLAAVLKTDVLIGNLKGVMNEKSQLQSSLDSATSDAVNFLASSGNFGTNTIDKEGVVSTFFSSLYSAMGITEDEATQSVVEAYIPVILLCDVDGYYIYYYDEFQDGSGNLCTERRWSEKMPYYYEDQYFKYRLMLSDHIIINDVHNLLRDELSVEEIDFHEIRTGDHYQNFRSQHKDCFLLLDETYELTKKGAIINQLEKVLSYYTNQYNMIARHNGITYQFTFPSSPTKEWAKYMDDVNLVVIFQGYPYGWDKSNIFNKVSSASANMIKKTVYYIEQKSWYFLAHKADCQKLKNNSNILNDTYDSLEECAKMGAYCDDCINHGARAPEIKKWY
jgi:hypothetical protein